MWHLGYFHRKLVGPERHAARSVVLRTRGKAFLITHTTHDVRPVKQITRAIREPGSSESDGSDYDLLILRVASSLS